MARPFFRRRKSCPFSGKDAPVIDYKDVRLLQGFVSERGKIVPSRITAVSGKDRKSTRLNSSHANISYAVFCLKKKKKDHELIKVTPWKKRMLYSNNRKTDDIDAKNLQVVARLSNALLDPVS